MFKKAFKAVISVATVVAMMPAPVQAASPSAVSLPSVAINPDQGYQIPAPKYKVTETKKVKEGKGKGRYTTVKKTVKKKYKNVIWTTDATNIRLSRSGHVTPLKAGNATVYGRSGNRVFSKKITVRYYHNFLDQDVAGSTTYHAKASNCVDVVSALKKSVIRGDGDCIIRCVNGFRSSEKKMNTIADNFSNQVEFENRISGGNCTKIGRSTYQFCFWYQLEEGQEKKLDAEAEKLARNITGTPIDKAIAINNILASTCKYDYKLNAGHAYNALLDHTAICMGYSAAFQRLAEKCGLDSCYVYTEDHVWNAFRYNKKWYSIDTTWNTPGDGCYTEYRQMVINGRVYHVPYYFGEGLQPPEHDNPLKYRNEEENSIPMLNILAKAFDQAEA